MSNTRPKAHSSVTKRRRRSLTKAAASGLEPKTVKRFCEDKGQSQPLPQHLLARFLEHQQALVQEEERHRAEALRLQAQLREIEEQLETRLSEEKARVNGDLLAFQSEIRHQEALYNQITALLIFCFLPSAQRQQAVENLCELLEQSFKRVQEKYQSQEGEREQLRNLLANLYLVHKPEVLSSAIFLLREWNRQTQAYKKQEQAQHNLKCDLNLKINTYLGPNLFFQQNLQNNAIALPPPPLMQRSLSFTMLPLKQRILYGLEKKEQQPSSTPISPIVVRRDIKDYRQGVMLPKINQYLFSKKRAPLHLNGHCHGITLAWLAMMDWGLGSLFEDMIKVIVDCPLEKINKLSGIIDFFLELIEPGQEPEKHSKNRYVQQDIEKIIGDAQKSYSIAGNFSKLALANELRGKFKAGDMTTIQGWSFLKEKFFMGTEILHRKGHSVGVYARENDFVFFNASDTRGEGQVVKSERGLIDLIWSHTFRDLEKRTVQEFRINTARSLKKPHDLIVSTARVSSIISEYRKEFERNTGIAVYPQPTFYK